MDVLCLLIMCATATANLTAPDTWLVAPDEGGRGGRVLFVPDRLTLTIAENPDYEPDWTETAVVDENGQITSRSLRNGWAFAKFESERDATVIVEGKGMHSIFVNGDRYFGDFYRTGWLRVPVHVKKGVNRIFVRSIRGGFSLAFSPADGDFSIGETDPVFPDLRRGYRIDLPASVILLNHTAETIRDLIIEVGDGDLFEHRSVISTPILPYSIAKPPFQLIQLREITDADLNEEGKYELSVTAKRGDRSITRVFPIDVRQPDQPYRETKLSGVDGSVQYYAVLPPINYSSEKEYSLYLSLHGAGVEARGQASAYRAKHEGFIVAPTNRRPFGFDWQEWGRLDAIETLELFMREHRIDHDRVYLTGHSMGGHGTWYVGALYPTRFAAIAPSAGWISFSTYGRRSQSEPPENILPFKWAAMENDTLLLLDNYRDLPIYILHGEKDDNVPVTQSRQMVEELSKFHKDFVYHEQPGAGHWWGGQCVDWPPLFDFLRRHARNEHFTAGRFVTPNPQISSTFGWITIWSQKEPSSPSAVEFNANARDGKIQISTENVRDLIIDPSHVMIQDRVELTIDGDVIELQIGHPAHLTLMDGEWRITEELDMWSKGAHRNGPFKLSFDKRMLWVYGTSGNDEENRAILAKVRYDSQAWWYRGNGNVEIIPDTEFSPEKFAGRNVILYGNADTNSAFDELLPDCPIRIERGGISVGDERYSGDLGIYMVYPRKGSDDNLVGVIGSTTAKATRFSQTARYFISGVTCPDFVLFDESVFDQGIPGVLRSGFFDQRWRLPNHDQD